MGQLSLDAGGGGRCRRVLVLPEALTTPVRVRWEKVGIELLEHSRRTAVAPAFDGLAEVLAKA